MTQIMHTVLNGTAKTLGVCRRRALIILGGTIAGFLITAVNTEATKPAGIVFRQGGARTLTARGHAATIQAGLQGMRVGDPVLDGAMMLTSVERSQVSQILSRSHGSQVTHIDRDHR